jgi:hypothetical protein
MEVTVKTMKLTKSKILQMEYLGVPKVMEITVLGYVNIDKKRYVIVKYFEKYYRAEYILNVEKKMDNVQLTAPDRIGYIYPSLNHTRYTTYNRNNSTWIVDKNDELYICLTSFKRKTESAGQIYY